MMRNIDSRSRLVAHESLNHERHVYIWLLLPIKSC
jgi:hypothetical protein